VHLLAWVSRLFKPGTGRWSAQSRQAQPATPVLETKVGTVETNRSRTLQVTFFLLQHGTPLADSQDRYNIVRYGTFRIAYRSCLSSLHYIGLTASRLASILRFRRARETKRITSNGYPSRAIICKPPYCLPHHFAFGKSTKLKSWIHYSTQISVLTPNLHTIYLIAPFSTSIWTAS
jgi:hypothetical protein